MTKNALTVIPPPANPWDNEPDEKVWVDEDTSLLCCTLRSPVGCLCGYVGIPPEHPLHNKDYMDIEIDVHGGLTYGNLANPSLITLQHIASPLLWFFGFDCGHGYDIIPQMLEFDKDFYKGVNATYKDIEFVRKECEGLAGKLKGWG